MKLCIRITVDSEGTYTAVCPSLPGCSCRGRTREEAKERLDEAIRGYIAAVSNFVPENLQHEVVEV
jgi:predicted RNase H-like HicB family nuclease